MPNYKQDKTGIFKNLAGHRLNRLDKKISIRREGNLYHSKAGELIECALEDLKNDLNDSEFDLLFSAKESLVSLYAERLAIEGVKEIDKDIDYGESLKALLPYLMVESKRQYVARRRNRTSRVRRSNKGEMIKEISRRRWFNLRLPCCKAWPLTYPLCRKKCDCTPKC